MRLEDVMTGSGWRSSEYFGQDEVAVDDEFRYIFELLMRMSDEDKAYSDAVGTDAPTGAFSAGVDEYSYESMKSSGVLSEDDYESRNTVMIDKFINSEGSGIIIYQVPTYLPPEEKTSTNPNYGFLDPTKPFQFGTLAQFVQASPNTPMTIRDGAVDVEYATAHDADGEYTTNDLGGGWTWSVDSKERYYDGNFYEAANSGFNDLLSNYINYTSTLIYEATVVNWFDSVALNAVALEGDDFDDVNEYGAVLKGDYFFDFGSDLEWIDLPEGFEETYYAYEQLSENIALQSESVRPVNPRIIRSGEGESGALWIDPLDTGTSYTASEVATYSKYAEWPWLNYRDGISSGFIEDIWAALSFPDYGTATDDSTYTIPLIYVDIHMADTLLTRWRRWSSDTPKGETHYYNTRISAAVDELGPTLYYATLPMKFVVKAQSSKEVNKNKVSALVYTDDYSDSESPLGAAMSEGASDGVTY